MILEGCGEGDITGASFRLDKSVTDRAAMEEWIAQAGIDVFEEKEPPDPDFPLIQNEQAICTPHLSWLSEEAGWSIREKIVEDINDVPPMRATTGVLGPCFIILYP